MPTDPNAGPGDASPTPGIAGGLFKQVCADNRASLSSAQTVLAGMPFTLNPTDDIYYHNDYNLSFRTIDGICSMVWEPSAEPAVYAATIQSVAPDALVEMGDYGLMGAAILANP